MELGPFVHHLATVNRHKKRVELFPLYDALANRFVRMLDEIGEIHLPSEVIEVLFPFRSVSHVVVLTSHAVLYPNI